MIKGFEIRASPIKPRSLMRQQQQHHRSFTYRTAGLIFVSILVAVVVTDGKSAASKAKRIPAAVREPTPDTWEGRRDQLIQSGLANPYPASGPWHDETFALAAYFSNTRVPEADAAMLDDAKLMAESKTLARGHWDIYFLVRLYDLFGPTGTVAPNRMSADAQAGLLKTLWAWTAPRGRMALVAADFEWCVWNSENHTAQAWASLWGACHILASSPDYQNRAFSDGSTPARLAAGLDAYWKQWAFDRASHGLFVEINSNYNRYTVATFHNFYDFAQDPELKRRMGLLLDLYWADWAIENINGVRGGSRARCYPGRLSITAGSSEEDAWLHFGIGDRGNVPTVWCALTSTYRPPAEIVDLATRPSARGTYTYMSRRLGLAATESTGKDTEMRHFFGGEAPFYRLNPQQGGIVRTTYVTPDFVLGASMTENHDPNDWTAISAQNRWDGVIFAGNKTARIFVQPESTKKEPSFDAYSTAVSQGVFVAQRVKGALAKGNRVWFDKSLQVQHANGWVFLESAQAYAAVKVVRGATTWKADNGKALGEEDSVAAGTGRWLTCADEFSPIVMEVSPQSKFTDFAAFQNQILANPLSAGSDGGIDYRSAAYATKVSFGGQPLRPLKIDDVPVDFRPTRVYDSPFLFSDFGTGLITVRDTAGREKILNFNAQP